MGCANSAPQIQLDEDDRRVIRSAAMEAVGSDAPLQLSLKHVSGLVFQNNPQRSIYSICDEVCRSEIPVGSMPNAPSGVSAESISAQLRKMLLAVQGKSFELLSPKYNEKLKDNKGASPEEKNKALNQALSQDVRSIVIAVAHDAIRVACGYAPVLAKEKSDPSKAPERQLQPVAPQKRTPSPQQPAPSTNQQPKRTPSPQQPPQPPPQQQPQPQPQQQQQQQPQPQPQARNVVLPEGDWEQDAASPDMYWSETQGLFYHPDSQHFYDPKSNMWYNPKEDRWFSDDAIAAGPAAADTSAPPPQQPSRQDESVVLPQGQWEADPSGLYWSEEQHLFYDPKSQHFYDPESKMWYDPELGEWYNGAD